MATTTNWITIIVAATMNCLSLMEQVPLLSIWGWDTMMKMWIIGTLKCLYLLEEILHRCLELLTNYSLIPSKENLMKRAIAMMV